MTVKLKDMPNLQYLKSGEVTTDEEGNLVWQNGEKPTSRTIACEQILKTLKSNLTNWNQKDVNDLYHILADIEILVAPERLRDVIDLSRLPSEPVPAEIKKYPVWAMDTSGLCLAGAGKMTIIPLKEIREWFVTRKPGYCTRPDEKGCYLCRLTKNQKDCRSNPVVYPE